MYCCCYCSLYVFFCVALIDQVFRHVHFFCSFFFFLFFFYSFYSESKLNQWMHLIGSCCLLFSLLFWSCCCCCSFMIIYYLFVKMSFECSIVIFFQPQLLRKCHLLFYIVIFVVPYDCISFIWINFTDLIKDIRCIFILFGMKWVMRFEILKNWHNSFSSFKFTLKRNIFKPPSIVFETEFELWQTKFTIFKIFHWIFSWKNISASSKVSRVIVLKFITPKFIGLIVEKYHGV